MESIASVAKLKNDAIMPDFSDGESGKSMNFPPSAICEVIKAGTLKRQWPMRPVAMTRSAVRPNMAVISPMRAKRSSRVNPCR